MNSDTQNSQIFIQAPDLQIPIQTLTLTPNFTIHNLKQLFFKTKSYPLAITSSSYFTLNGRILPEKGTVKTTGVQDFETLTLKLRLYGGGGDGGSTCAESRNCYLNGVDGVEGVKVSGTKRGSELKVEKVNGKIETSGKGVKGVEVNGKSEGKRFKAADMAPPNVNKDVYASILLL